MSIHVSLSGNPCIACVLNVQSIYCIVFVALALPFSFHRFIFIPGPHANSFILYLLNALEYCKLYMQQMEMRPPTLSVLDFV